MKADRALQGIYIYITITCDHHEDEEEDDDEELEKLNVMYKCMTEQAVMTRVMAMGIVMVKEHASCSIEYAQGDVVEEREGLRRVREDEDNVLGCGEKQCGRSPTARRSRSE